MQKTVFKPWRKFATYQNWYFGAFLGLVWLIDVCKLQHSYQVTVTNYFNAKYFLLLVICSSNSLNGHYRPLKMALFCDATGKRMRIWASGSSTGQPNVFCHYASICCSSTVLVWHIRGYIYCSNSYSGRYRLLKMVFLWCGRLKGIIFLSSRELLEAL